MATSNMPETRLCKYYQPLRLGKPRNFRLKWSIQYAAAFRFHCWRFAMLDHPLSRMMTPTIQFSNSHNNFKRAFAISRRDAPESCIYLPPIRGRGECRVPAAPAVSCALCIGKKHTSNNEYTGIARHSRTQWFYDLLRALPGDRACLTPSSADMFCLSPVGPTQLREL